MIDTVVTLLRTVWHASFTSLDLVQMRVPIEASHNGQNPGVPVSNSHLAQQPLLEPETAYNPDYASPPAEWPSVKLRLEVKDMGHSGAKLFFEHVNAAEALSDAVLTVFKWLYTKRTCPRQ